MAAIQYMRFRLQYEESYLYLVGVDPSVMRKDAQLFVGVRSGCEDGEVVNSEVVLNEARKRCFPESSLKNAVDAARTGTPSFYLFG